MAPAVCNLFKGGRVFYIFRRKMRYQPKNVQWPPITRFLKSLGVDIKVHTKPLPATLVMK